VREGGLVSGAPTHSRTHTGSAGTRYKGTCNTGGESGSHRSPQETWRVFALAEVVCARYLLAARHRPGSRSAAARFQVASTIAVVAPTLCLSPAG